MKAFLSWSGNKSHQVALLFSEWLPCVVQAIEPWVSSKDIDRGSIWFNEISEQLKECGFGIVFVTKDNQGLPWLLFEAGALSKGLTENRVCTVLVDLNVRDIEAGSPLRQLNHTTLQKQSVLELIKTINRHLEGGQIQEKHLDKSFGALWQDLDTKLRSIGDTIPVSDENTRQDSDVLNDILENVLSINRKITTAIFSKETGRFIAKHQARALLNRLLKMDMDRGDIEEAMEDVVPDYWVKEKLDGLFGIEVDED